MGVDDAEGRLLPGEIEQQPRQQRMFEHVGEIAGVKGVAVVHDAGVPLPTDDSGMSFRTLAERERSGIQRRDTDGSRLSWIPGSSLREAPE